jgi:hypothetical protein
MTGLEAFLASLFTPDNFKELIGITFLVLWLWSEKLSYSNKTCANGVIQRFAPLVKAIGEKMAPPVIVKCLETFEASQTKTVTATQATTEVPTTVTTIDSSSVSNITKETP